MSKKAGNKSQAIRDALEANPGMSPKEVAEMLVAKGFKVNAQYVSTIKSNAKVKASRTVVRRKPAGGASGSSRGAGLEPMAAAMAFVRATGSVQSAREFLDALEEFRSL